MLFPCKCVSDNGVEILKSRSPGERRSNAINIRNQYRRVAGTAGGNIDRKIATACAPHCVDHLEHRSAMAITAVEGRVDATTTQIGECRRMRLNQVADVDLVANAGTVGRRIVGSEYVHLGTLADCCLTGDLDQVGRGRRCLSGT